MVMRGLRQVCLVDPASFCWILQPLWFFFPLARSLFLSLRLALSLSLSPLVRPAGSTSCATPRIKHREALSTCAFLSLSRSGSVPLSLPPACYLIKYIQIRNTYRRKSTNFVVAPASTQVRWLEMARHSAAETESSLACV